MRKDIRPQAMALAIPFIKRWEGFRDTAYLCPAGKWTIGYGNTVSNGKPVKKGDKLTKEDADKLVVKTVATFMDGVLKVVKYPYLSPNQLAALTSFAFNVGMGAFMASTMLKMINLGNVAGAAEQFKRWDKATVNGKLVQLAGLTSRRKQERELFNGSFLGFDKPVQGSSPSALPTQTKVPQIAQVPENPDPQEAPEELA